MYLTITLTFLVRKDASPFNAAHVEQISRQPIAC